MKYVVLALFLCVATTLGKFVTILIFNLQAVRSENEYRSSFLKFMHTHSKFYAHDQFQAKYQTFKNNVDIVDTNNAADNGLVLAINKFADLSRFFFRLS
jgi:hypothetical protein